MPRRKLDPICEGRSQTVMCEKGGVVGKRKETDEVVDCSHCDNPSAHEPAGDPGGTASVTRRGEDGDPTVLAARGRIGRAHFCERVGDGKREHAYAEPGPDHDGRATRDDAQDQCASKGSPASDDGEAEADHAE